MLSLDDFADDDEMLDLIIANIKTRKKIVFKTIRPMVSTTRRPILLTTRINKIKQEEHAAVPIIRSVFPETWIFDFIDDTIQGYFCLIMIGFLTINIID